MKTTTLLIGLTISGIVPAFAQGYIDFSWFGSGSPTAGIQLGNSAVCSQLPGWYLAGDYTVEAFMAFGVGQPESSLFPIASTRTTFLGGATTTAAGSPGSDGSGWWWAGVQDTGLAVGIATIEVRAWYDPNHNLTWDQALQLSSNPGRSSSYNINLLSNIDPNIQSLDRINFQPFRVGLLDPSPSCPEPSAFMLASMGFVALLIFHRRK